MAALAKKGFMSFWFYIFILFTAIGQLDRLDLGNGLIIHFSDLLLFVVTVYWLINVFINGNYKRIILHPLFKYISLFFIVCIVSLLFNIPHLNVNQFLISLLYPLRWVLYTGCFFIVSGFNKTQKDKTILVLIISQTILVILGFIQYYFYPDLRNLYYLGWDEHLYRLFSTVLDPNFAALHFSLLIILLLSYLLNNKYLSNNKKYIFASICIISFAALLLTYSRSGYLTVIAGIVTLSFISRKNIISIVLLLLFVTGIIFLPKGLQSEGVNLTRTASIHARSRSFNQAVNIFLQNPVFGVGFNAYRYAQIRYSYITTKQALINHAASGTDNSLLFILATSGVPGLLIFCLLIYKIYRIVKYNLDKDFEHTLIYAFIASGVALFINSLFINSMFYPFAMFWIWTLLGISTTD